MIINFIVNEKKLNNNQNTIKSDNNLLTQEGLHACSPLKRFFITHDLNSRFGGKKPNEVQIEEAIKHYEEILKNCDTHSNYGNANGFDIPSAKNCAEKVKDGTLPLPPYITTLYQKENDSKNELSSLEKLIYSVNRFKYGFFDELEIATIKDSNARKYVLPYKKVIDKFNNGNIFDLSQKEGREGFINKIEKNLVLKFDLILENDKKHSTAAITALTSLPNPYRSNRFFLTLLLENKKNIVDYAKSPHRESISSLFSQKGVFPNMVYVNEFINNTKKYLGDIFPNIASDEVISSVTGMLIGKGLSNQKEERDKLQGKLNEFFDIIKDFCNGRAQGNQVKKLITHIAGTQNKKDLPDPNDLKDFLNKIKEKCINNGRCEFEDIRLIIRRVTGKFPGKGIPKNDELLKVLNDIFSSPEKVQKVIEEERVKEQNEEQQDGQNEEQYEEQDGEQYEERDDEQHEEQDDEQYEEQDDEQLEEQNEELDETLYKLEIGSYIGDFCNANNYIPGVYALGTSAINYIKNIATTTNLTPEGIRIHLEGVEKELVKRFNVILGNEVEKDMSLITSLTNLSNKEDYEIFLGRLLHANGKDISEYSKSEYKKQISIIYANQNKIPNMVKMKEFFEKIKDACDEIKIGEDQINKIIVACCNMLSSLGTPSEELSEKFIDYLADIDSVCNELKITTPDEKANVMVAITNEFRGQGIVDPSVTKKFLLIIKDVCIKLKIDNNEKKLIFIKSSISKENIFNPEELTKIYSEPLVKTVEISNEPVKFKNVRISSNQEKTTKKKAS